jgi:hypothetical protein
MKSFLLFALASLVASQPGPPTFIPRELAELNYPHLGARDIFCPTDCGNGTCCGIAQKCVGTPAQGCCSVGSTVCQNGPWCCGITKHCCNDAEGNCCPLTYTCTVVNGKAGCLFSLGGGGGGGGGGGSGSGNSSFTSLGRTSSVGSITSITSLGSASSTGRTTSSVRGTGGTGLTPSATVPAVSEARNVRDRGSKVGIGLVVVAFGACLL